MENFTSQEQNWRSAFGDEYTVRNPLDIESMEKLYIQNYGVTREDLDREFLDAVPRSSRILEVGANVGLQLVFLQKIGFSNLYGIEINPRAIELSRSTTQGLHIIQGSALDIPFKERCFDLVFTSGLLIHISPTQIKKVIEEIHRCAKKYIWGFKYYAPSYTEIVYRGNADMLWKADFAQPYLDVFGDLKLIKERRIPYVSSENIDTMFLLEKA